MQDAERGFATYNASAKLTANVRLGFVASCQVSRRLESVVDAIKLFFAGNMYFPKIKKLKKVCSGI